MTPEEVRKDRLRIYTELTSDNGGIFAFAPFAMSHVVWVEEQEAADREAALLARIAELESQSVDKADAWDAATAIPPKAAKRITELEGALSPFSAMAGVLFSRNWNNEDVVFAVDHKRKRFEVLARHFFVARAALGGRKDG